MGLSTAPNNLTRRVLRDQRNLKTLKAAHRLSALIKKRLGVEVTPKQLEIFLTRHWRDVSILAHRVHGDMP